MALRPPGEPFPDRKVVAPDGQQPGLRALPVELRGQGQDRGRPKRVAQGRHPVIRLDRRESEGLAQPPPGIDKNDDVLGGAGQRVLDVELVVGVARDAPEAALFQPFGGRGSQAVVAAAGVADPQDEGFRGRRSARNQRTFLWRTRPPASTRVTSSGIRPRAWVAQLRHGS